ncbi:MAG: hypothetical protein PF482_19725, partial [Desulfobacteraceae bacterium]|nr:hypothetical protein [Desulfobacteraceae bacterium]
MGLNRETCYLCRASGQILHKDMKDHLFGAPGNWNYKSCEACGLIWLTPLPEDTEMSYINYYTHENAEEPKSVTKNKIEKLKTGIAAAAFGYP